jgi:hypothetical protein
MKLLVRYGIPLATFWSGGLAVLLIDAHSKLGTLPSELVYQMTKWPYYALLYVIGV